MHRIDLVEIAGSLLILAAFAAGQTRRLRQDSRTALSLNLVGSATLAVIAFSQRSWGFLLLEGIWALVSFTSLTAALLRTADRRFEHRLTSKESPVAGEKDLRMLLAGMCPQLNTGEYVFTVAPDGCIPAGVRPVVTVAEEEGLTLVLPRQDADRTGLAYDYVAGWITLRVHSALESVGLTAAVAEALARVGISCNVVAGFHHDHLFVPHADALRARDTLELLTH
jgi:hypothetical protein